ncbi:MAG: bifunctional DNA-formamidopyrimidine glycosylase/DNA-(apurinic or apyrimidinic site) lyase [Phycisphaerales bacterium]|nr:MAG: bifunctional DNA-formamidopyrimidine glycosylase/DNA-(apurinic or apyrimidinic site) lyase [Phycisphaerales bacterium]
MPELPEVESIRRSLEPTLRGSRVTSVDLRRADIAHDEHDRTPSPEALLQGATIDRLERKGKQLAIVSSDGRVLVVHLGMSGNLRLLEQYGGEVDLPPHTHAVWSLKSSSGPATLFFRDPRRFGGLTTLSSLAAVSARWQELGPDALTVAAASLAERLKGTRAIKAALLDQSVIAGVGNIYADEALFLAGIHPKRRVSTLRPFEIARLADSIQNVLEASIQAGGTTLRDYANAAGRPGGFQKAHNVYARAGRPCVACGASLRAILLAQRTTTYCPTCQPVRTPIGRGFHTRSTLQSGE